MVGTKTKEGTGVLERQAICQAQAREKKEFLDELAEKSAELLGYHQLKKRVTAETKPEEILAQLEIKPFTTDSVRKYQDQMVLQDRPFFVRHGNFLAGLMLCVAVLSLTALLLVGVPAAIAGANWFSAFATTSIVTVILSVVFGIRVSNKYDSYAPGQWRRTAFKEYEEPVPTFAVSTAVELKERLPDAEFFVEKFEEGRYVKRVRDPFLVMEAGGQTFYLEVWQEPDFRAKRQI